MRKIETIECARYTEPDAQGRVRQIGMKRVGEVFEALECHLRNVGLLPDEYFILSALCEADKEIPDFHTAMCNVDWGVSEGIYLDISFLHKQGQMFSFATGKTLVEGGDAFLRMSRIAAECSMMLNGRGRTVEVPDETVNAETKDAAYDVAITETLRKVVRVEADEAESVDEAEQIVRARWKREEVVLDAECFSDVEFEGTKVISE